MFAIVTRSSNIETRTPRWGQWEFLSRVVMHHQRMMKCCDMINEHRLSLVTGFPREFIRRFCKATNLVNELRREKKLNLEQKNEGGARRGGLTEWKTRRKRKKRWVDILQAPSLHRNLISAINKSCLSLCAWKTNLGRSRWRGKAAPGQRHGSKKPPSLKLFCAKKAKRGNQMLRRACDDECLIKIISRHYRDTLSSPLRLLNWAGFGSVLVTSKFIGKVQCPFPRIESLLSCDNNFSLCSNFTSCVLFLIFCCKIY